MSEQMKIHATLVEIKGQGVLICGKSGCGKSDLALRLIMRYGARLVADDVVILERHGNEIIGYAPEKIRGLLEIRGIGVVRRSCLPRETVALVVRLLDDVKQIERMPKDAYENILGLEIAQIDLYAKENSAPEKVLVKLGRATVNDEEI